MRHFTGRFDKLTLQLGGGAQSQTAHSVRSLVVDLVFDDGFNLQLTYERPHDLLEPKRTNFSLFKLKKALSPSSRLQEKIQGFTITHQHYRHKFSYDADWREVVPDTTAPLRCACYLTFFFFFFSISLICLIYIPMSPCVYMLCDGILLFVLLFVV